MLVRQVADIGRARLVGEVLGRERKDGAHDEAVPHGALEEVRQLADPGRQVQAALALQVLVHVRDVVDEPVVEAGEVREQGLVVVQAQLREGVDAAADPGVDVGLDGGRPHARGLGLLGRQPGKVGHGPSAGVVVGLRRRVHVVTAAAVLGAVPAGRRENRLAAVLAFT